MPETPKPEETKKEAVIAVENSEDDLVTYMPVIARQVQGYDGTYLYHTVVCKNKSLTTTKLFLNLNVYEELEINGGAYYSKIGYSNTGKYIEVMGYVDFDSTSIAFLDTTIVSKTDKYWTKLAQYFYGILNYPSYEGMIDIGIGYKFPDVQYQNILQDNNGNIQVELPAGAYKYYATFYNNPAPSDRCFMNYDRKF